MRRWDSLLDTYMEEYVARGIGRATIGSVRRELERLGSWLKRRRPKPRLEELPAELLIRYLRDRTTFKSKATVSGVMSRIRCWGDFLVREGVWQDNPLRWMQGPKLTPYHRLPKRIGSRDMTALWSAAAASRQTRYRKHLGITLLSLLYGTGLRRGELQRLDVADWSREDGTLRIDGRKTGRERCFPVPSIVYHCIEAYLPHRANHLMQLDRFAQPALLVNRDGERLSEASVSHTVHRLARRAGIRLHSLHQFRHTFASDLLAAGVPVPDVQHSLGHSSIATTMRYLHIADPERHQAMARHPLNDWLLREAA